MPRARSASLVLAGLLAAGCSASSPAAVPVTTRSTDAAAPVPGDSTPPPSASSASSGSASAAGPRLTGTQLKSVLAPASWFPKGFTVDASGSQDSGETGKPAEPPAFGKLPCSRLNGTAWIDLGGIASTAFAQNDYIKAEGGQYIQEVDTYAGAQAQQVMAHLAATVKRCPTFHDDATGATVKVSAVKGPRLGDESSAIRLQGSNWAGDMTLQAVRVGTQVVTVAYSAGSGTSNAQATKLTTYVVDKLKKARSAG